MTPERDERVSALVSEAASAARAGRYREVVELLDEATQLHPDEGRLFHDRAVALTKLERWDAAMADFDRAVELDPTASTYEQRASVRYERGDKEGARQDWQTALEHDPGRPLPLANLGWLAIEDRRFDDAIALLDRAIAAEPTAAGFYQNRARAHYEFGHLAEAQADAERSMSLVEGGLDTTQSDAWE